MEQIQSMTHVVDLLDEIKKYIYVRLKEQEPIRSIGHDIRSSGGIVFCISAGRESAGIVFQRRKLFLDVIKQWGVKSTTLTAYTECLLTPCERNELKEGDIAFMTNSDGYGYNKLKDYYIIVNEQEAVHWSVLGDVHICLDNFTYNFKVEVA